MSEILEKLLLISFGLTVLIIVIPLFQPLLNNYLKMDENDEQTEIIENDLNQLNQNLKTFDNYIFQNISKNFIYAGQISVIIDSKSNGSTILLFRFNNNDSDITNYFKFQVEIWFEIIIESYNIHSYQINLKNNSRFLRFF
jgi:hypothetical protein